MPSAVLKEDSDELKEISRLFFNLNKTASIKIKKMHENEVYWHKWLSTHVLGVAS